MLKPKNKVIPFYISFCLHGTNGIVSPLMITKILLISHLHISLFS